MTAPDVEAALREALEELLFTAFESGWFDNTGDLGEGWRERKGELLEELSAALAASRTAETGEPEAKTLREWANWMRENPWPYMMARVSESESWWHPADFLEAVADQLGSPDFAAIVAGIATPPATTETP